LHGATNGGALNNQGNFNETYVDGQGGTGNLPAFRSNVRSRIRAARL
jgi:hypothetical protein